MKHRVTSHSGTKAKKPTSVGASPQARPTLRDFAPKGKLPSASSSPYALDSRLCDEPHNPTRREQALWRAVIVQMLTDAFSHSRKDEAQRHKREALIWLRGNSLDFRIVCEYAGYDPDYLRGKIAHLVATQQQLTARATCRTTADSTAIPSALRCDDELIMQ